MNTGDIESTYLPVDATGFEGFNEAARAFKFSGVTSDSPADGAMLKLIEARALETAKNSARDRLSAKISSMQLSPDLRAELEKRLDGLDGASNMDELRNLEATLGTDIRIAGQWAATERSVNDQEAKEAQLRDQMNAYKADSMKARDDLGKEGYHDTPENEKKLMALWAKLENLTPGSEEWNKTRNEIYTMDRGFFARVEQDALEHGDYKSAEKAHNAKVNAEKQQQAMDTNYAAMYEPGSAKKPGTIGELNALREQSKIQKTTHFDEDEEPVATQQKTAQKFINISKADAADIGTLPSPQTPGGKPVSDKAIG